MRVETTIPSLVGIYQIKNIATNKVYRGSSFNLLRRFKEHSRMLKYGYHYNSYLQTSYDKHGSDNFIFTVLEILYYCPNKEHLFKIEQKYIDEINPESLYNICPIAGSLLGTKFPYKKINYLITERHRSRLSKSHRSKYKNLPMGVTYSIRINKYLSQIWYEKRHFCFGAFDSIEEAENVYLEFKRNPDVFIKNWDKKVSDKKENFTSIYHGVHFVRSRNRYKALVKKYTNGKLKIFFQKLFKTEEEAHKARCEFIENWNRENDIKLR